MIPLTREGAPDRAACEALGWGRQLVEWDRRMAVVSDFHEAQAQARHGNKRSVAKAVAAKHGIGVRTVYRLNQLLAQGGPAAVFPQQGLVSNGPSLPTPLQLQIRQYWGNSRHVTFAQAYGDIVLPFYKDLERDPPHLSTIRRWVRKHVLPVEDLAFREGPRAYEAKGAPKVVRDLPKEPNDWWVADHRLWDTQIVIHDGQGTGWGKHGTAQCPCGSGRDRRNCCSVRRPWITLIADIATAGFVGWRMGLTPTAAGVCQAVRSAVRHFGLPRHWYRDNGREFTARRLGGDAARCRKPLRKDLGGHKHWPCPLPEDVEMSGMWIALGVEVVSALPYSPWSKAIESYFRAFSLTHENLLVGWTGRDAKQKPEQLDRQIANGDLLTWKEFEEVFARQVERWNSEHTCGDRQAPPLKLYEQWIEAGGEPREVSVEALSFLLQDRRAARVHQRGIELQAGGELHRYFSEDLMLYVNCDLPVSWDPAEPEGIWVYPPQAEGLPALPCLYVPEARNAQYGEWGEPNREARRGRRLQREFITRRAAEVKGATPPERLDPTGAVAMIQARKKAQTEKEQKIIQADHNLAAHLEEQREAAQKAEAAAREDRRQPLSEYRKLMLERVREIAGPHTKAEREAAAAYKELERAREEEEEKPAAPKPKSIYHKSVEEIA